MKARKKEFVLPKCLLCGETVDEDDCIIQSLSFQADDVEHTIVGRFHEKCMDKFDKAMVDGKNVSYDIMSHRIAIE